MNPRRSPARRAWRRRMGTPRTGLESLAIRRMEAADIPAGIRLCRISGWNQQERDWSRFLTLEPDGCFVACTGGQVCGTATTLRYGERLGWIGMVLVDPEQRGRGI